MRASVYCVDMTNTTQTQTTTDQPKFGDVQCKNFDEHRSDYRRVRGGWHCDICHEDDYKHGDDRCELNVRLAR